MNLYITEDEQRLLGHYDPLKPHANKDIMKRLYDLNHGKLCALKPSDSSAKRMLIALHCAYALSFTCHLRLNEIVDLRIQDVVQDGESIIIHLPRRKTMSADAERVTVLPAGGNEAHLCAHQAVMEWLQCVSHTEGYLLPKFNKGGLLVGKSKALLQMLRNDLHEIGIPDSGCTSAQYLRVGGMLYAIRRRVSAMHEREKALRAEGKCPRCGA
ncbi:hypothetical protein EV714DRAFT_276698 [Schizophyllum commune]